MINPPKTACGWPFGGVLHFLTLWNAFVNVQLRIPGDPYSKGGNFELTLYDIYWQLDQEEREFSL